MFTIASILRTIAIYLGLVQPDTGDLCVACQYDLAPRGGAFCQRCEEPCFWCGKSGCKCENTVPEHFFG